MNIVEMLDAMSTPPAPAPEVVTLDRPIIEAILAELEAADPLRAVVTGLRAALAAPRPELWVMFTPGPNETYAFGSKEDADQAAADLIAVGQRLKAEMIARGESVEFWHEWRAEVVLSPWEPAEHFEEMALEKQEDAESLRAMAVDSAAEIEALKKEVARLRQHNAALADIAAERHRQITDEGYTIQRDNDYNSGEMAAAAGCYAIASAFPVAVAKVLPGFWLWGAQWWKPSAVPRRNLVKAGALIVAEIERLDRKAAPATHETCAREMLG